MHNKLVILTFIFTLSGATFAQGESNLAQNIQISIYPNPAIEFIVVQIEGDIDNAEFELNSMIGNKIQIKPEDLGIGKYKIHVKNLTTGYYFLLVKDEKKRFKKAYRFLKR